MNKNVDSTPRTRNDKNTGQFVNQRTVTVVGERETVRNQVVQQSRIQCYNSKVNMEMEPDIKNMMISEYLEYEAAKERRLWDDDDDSEEDQEEDGDDRDTFDMWDITVEEVEQIRKFFNVLDETDKMVQPLIPEPIHTTPPNDDFVTPTTKSILDELLEEFGDEILNVTMVNDEADFNPTKDLEELERLLAKEPQSNFTEIQLYKLKHAKLNTATGTVM
ncbi:hypothetical protein Tco_0122844 [Tanacetum coccineum]